MKHLFFIPILIVSYHQILGRKYSLFYNYSFLLFLAFSECKSSSIETPEKQMECFINHSTENDYIEADSSTEILTPYPMEFKVLNTWAASE
jgi:hypothetical protein